MGRSLPILHERYGVTAQQGSWLPLPAIIMIALVLLLGATGTALSQVREWKLADPQLHARTTAALHRYFTYVKTDSLRLRYLRNNEPRMQYRLRARLGASDSLGQIISISIGQIILYPSTTIRIALGEDLYASLLLSRRNAASEERTVIEWDTFGHDNWEDGSRVIVSLDRLDWRFTESLGGFVAAGAPESNLPWWSDGTWRIGLTSAAWEIGAVLPFAGGSTSVGPLRARLLAPGFGAAAMVRTGPITGRVRFTAIGDMAFQAPHAGNAVYVHTLSGQVTYADVWETFLGTIRGDVGVGYEEFTRARLDEQRPVSDGEVRRLSPIADLTWISAQGNMRFSVGVADLAPHMGFSARLTHILWIEATLAAADALRARKPFEHSAYLFITPRIKF